MKIQILDSCGADRQFLISYLCNESVAIDAGCIGLLVPLERQQAVRHIFLSHSHIDHTATLPVFLDNVYAPGPDCARIYGLPETLAVLRSDMFNDRIWPDFVRLSQPQNRFLEFVPLECGRTVTVEGLRITAVELRHVVPTVGYVIADDQSAVAIISDTLPTDRVWEYLEEVPNLRGVFLEVSFPNSMAWLAESAAHLTPLDFAGELRKLNREVSVIAVHLKPRYREQLIAELAVLDLPRMEVGQCGKTYEF